MDKIKRILSLLWDKYQDLEKKHQALVAVVIIVAFIFIVT